MERLRPGCCLVEEQNDGMAPKQEYSLRFWDDLALKNRLNALVPANSANAVLLRERCLGEQGLGPVGA